MMVEDFERASDQGSCEGGSKSTAHENNDVDPFETAEVDDVDFDRDGKNHHRITIIHN